MKFTLEFDLGNDAVQTRSDIEAILRKLGRKLAFMNDPPEVGDEGNIRDENGNTIGGWGIIE